MTRREKLAEAVRYLDCATAAIKDEVTAARLLLSDFAPHTRALAPLLRARVLLLPHSEDREVQAALGCVAELLARGGGGGAAES